MSIFYCTSLKKSKNTCSNNKVYTKKVVKEKKVKELVQCADKYTSSK